jgi:transcriptional regulator with XRE-family HTH domain
MFRFHYERLVRRLTQKQFAGMCGINQVYLGLMENGRMTPNEEELTLMSHALRVYPPSILLKPVLVEPPEVEEPQAHVEAR